MKIGILTGGGDCPGLNAVIRSVVKTCAIKGHEVYGVMESFNGFRYKEPKIKRLEEADVRHILYRGGTILQTTNTGNPFKYDPSNADEAKKAKLQIKKAYDDACLLYTSPSPRDRG